MIYITNADGSIVEPIINIGEDFSIQQNTDGDFMVTFSTFNNEKNIGYETLKNESYINVDGYEFTVKNLSENEYSKKVTATSKFFDNSKKQIRGTFNGSHTLMNHLNFVLNGSGWVYDIDADISNVVNYIENLGNDNVISLLEKVIKSHNVEYIILKGNRIRFSKLIGNDQDFQLRYKYNVGDVVSNVDTSSLYTYVTGTGAEGVTASYTSPNASTFGLLEDSVVSDERFTSSVSLQEYLKANLNDTPDISIESSVPILTERSTGEKIWLIYPPLNLELETRIISQNKTIVNGELVTSSVILGNSKNKSSVDLAVSQQQEIQENESQINETKQQFRSEIKVTNDRITLEVEEIDRSIAAIDIKADNINLSVNNRITNEVAMIDIRANQIQLSVNDLDNRTSSSITQLSNNINLKIDKGGAITDINLSPGVATINADRINLNGAVFVNGSISGATTIQVSTDIDLGRRIRFNDFTAITSGDGSITIEAFNNLNYVATTHYFNGTVDFSNANVIGL